MDYIPIQELREITEWVYVQSGIELPFETICFEVYQNPRGKQSVLGRIGYRGPIAPRGDLPRIKLGLTNDEAGILVPVIREVHHVYSDRPTEGIQALCYSYEEVFSEKSGCRARLAGRKPDNPSAKTSYLFFARGG